MHINIEALLLDRRAERDGALVDLAHLRRVAGGLLQARVVEPPTAPGEVRTGPPSYPTRNTQKCCEQYLKRSQNETGPFTVAEVETLISRPRCLPCTTPEFAAASDHTS